MTTPDPTHGPGTIPDDATSTYDADAALAASIESAATPWPATDAAQWPPVEPVAPGAPDAPDAPAPVVSVPADGPPPSPGAGAGVTGSAPPPRSVPPAWAQAPDSSPGGSVPPGGTVPPSLGWQSGMPPATPARSSTPGGLVAGVILVIIGAALLVSRLVDINLGSVTWPLWIVVPGAGMLVGSFFIPPRGGLGLAVPGAIVTMVGVVLWVQEVYGLYATWAYAWALVAPTGPGLGMLLYGLVQRDGELAGDGFRTMLVGLGLFLGFALFFEGVIGLSGDPIPNLDQLAPYGIIALGVLLVVLSFFGNGKRREGRRHPHA